MSLTEDKWNAMPCACKPFETCEKCRHSIILPCLECGKYKQFFDESLIGRGILNYFCSGECEDRFAFKQ